MLRILDVFYFAVFFFITSLCSFVFASAVYFSRGLCPYPFAFCKKRNQKLLFLFLCVLIFYLYKQVGCQRTTTNALRSENATHFRLPLTACLFFIASLCLSFFTAASLFSRGLRPHPHAFCKKRGKNFYVSVYFAC